MSRWLLPVILATFAGWAMAQNPPAAAEKPKPAAPEMPPDAKAFNEANRIADGQKKIDALEKWKTDFPQSAMRSAADTSILITLIKKFPAQHDRIEKQAKAMYRAAEPKRREQMANSIANQLLDGDLLLKDAESYARKSMSSMREDRYVKTQKASFARNSRPGAPSRTKPPSDEELRKRFRENRAARLATLGRIEVKLGKVEAGRKMLEESTPSIPTSLPRPQCSVSWLPETAKMPRHSTTWSWRG